MTIADPDMIAAAERVFDTHGLAGSTLELIAAEAGLNRVTLYRKGLNVEILAAAAISKAADEYAAAVLPALVTSVWELGSRRFVSSTPWAR